jgi:hypothetical protein
MKAREEVASLRAVREVESRYKHSMRLKEDRIVQYADSDARVQQHRLRIVEDILTLKCRRPECDAAILDFDGCFAVRCFRCAWTFCGWCLEECNNDSQIFLLEGDTTEEEVIRRAISVSASSSTASHKHVAACARNPHKGVGVFRRVCVCVCVKSDPQLLQMTLLRIPISLRAIYLLGC